MPGRQNFNPDGKLKIQVQIHNLVHDNDTFNKYLTGLSVEDVDQIVEELKKSTIDLFSPVISMDPQPYDEGQENNIDKNKQEENERKLRLDKNDVIKSYNDFTQKLEMMTNNKGHSSNKVQLKNVLVFIDNCYGGYNIDLEEDSNPSKFIDIIKDHKPTTVGPEREADLAKTQVSFMHIHGKKLKETLSKFPKLEQGYKEPVKKQEDSSFDDSDFIDEQKANKSKDYNASAERFKDYGNVVKEMERLDKLYHQMYDISNRMTDSSEFKKMLGSLKEIHEVYTFNKNNGNLNGQEYTGDDLVNLIKETAENTTKYIDKLDATNKYRSSDKGNTKLLGAVQVLSIISPEYTKQQYSNLKLKMPDGHKAEIVKNPEAETVIYKKGTTQKITFDNLVKDVAKETKNTKKVADNKARREYSRMKKRAAKPPVIDNSLKNNNTL